MKTAPMLQFALVTAVIVLSLLLPQSASVGATVIDFDQFSVGLTDETFASPYVEEGFELSIRYTDGQEPLPFVKDSAFRIFGSLSLGFTGQQSVTTSWTPMDTVLRRTSGEPFRLVSIDLWELMNTPRDTTVNDTHIEFVGRLRDGSAVSHRVILNKAWGVETINFPDEFSSIVSMTWNGDGRILGEFGDLWGFHQYDNIVVAPIPEPTGSVIAALLLSARFLRNRSSMSRLR